MSSSRSAARYCAFVVLASVSPLCVSQTVEIVTGAGRYVDVPGTSVPVAPNSIVQMAIAPDGKVYISDLNSKLLRYDPATGTATALPANDDDVGFKLGYTTGIAFDQNGAFHVVANGRLRLVDPDEGTTTDLGPFYSTDQMTFGPDGTVYFVTGDYKVYARLPSGVITTIAGTTEGFSGDGGPAVNAQLMYLRGIAMGPDGNLYVSDFGNHRIRRIDLTTGIIDTVVGPYNFPDPRNPNIPITLMTKHPLAFDPAGNMVLGLGDHRIVRIDAVSGQVTLVAGAGYGNSGDGGPAVNALINHPETMAFDAAGNLYFADQGVTAGSFNHVRRVDAATGIITRVLGNNTAYFCGENVPARFACFSQAYGLDVDAGQNLIISDVGNKLLRTIGANNQQVSTVPSTTSPPSGLPTPLGIEHDAAGNIYFASFSGYQVNKIDAVTRVRTRIAGTGNYGYSGDGGWAINAMLAAPVDVAVDASGYIYIADSGNNRIRRLDTATPRNISTFFNFNAPGTVEVDGSGNLIVAGGECRILRIHIATSSISNVAGTGTCATQEPAGGTLATSTNIGSGATFALAPNGDFYLAWSNTLYRIEPATGLLTRVPAPPGGLATADGVHFTRPAKMEFDAAGNLYLTDDQKPHVFRISGLLDSTPPIVEPRISGTAGNLGWYRSNVHVAWNVSDPESAIRTPACAESDVFFDTDGIVFTCTATSSGGTTTRSVTIRRDTVPPSYELAIPMPPEDSGGWYHDDVLIHYNARDERSGVYFTSSPSPLRITGEGAYIPVSFTISDTAGNTWTETNAWVRIDRSPPNVSADVFGPRGRDPSWFIGDARIRWNVSDSLSPVHQREGCDDVVVSTDTAGTTYTCTARSGGGSASHSVTVKRDTVPPTVTFGVPSPAPNAQGWNNTEVSLPYTLSDATSGVEPLSVDLPNPFIFSEDGPGQVLAFLIHDIAGNHAEAHSSPINIDRSPPIVQPSLSGTLGNNGWYTSDVFVSFDIDEEFESIIDRTGCEDTTVTQDTAGVTFTCTVISAGGSASSSITVKRDTTPPVVDFGTPSPLPNANGWNKTNVNFPFTRTDALSGVASQSAASPLVLSTEGEGLTAEVTVTDNAGNSTTATSPARNIDKTVPLIEIGAPSPNATYGFYADGEANYYCHDTSPATCTGTVANGAQFNTSSAGTRTFRVNARDSVNFTASQSFTYFVLSRFQFDGFLAPASPPPMLNLVPRGALVPIRWQLPNPNGSFVTNPASFVSATVGSLSCGSAPSSPLNDTASGPAGLSFDDSTNTFTYNWQTNPGWTGCRKLTIKLKDQTTHELRFRFQ